MQTQFTAFTTHFGGRVNQLSNNVGISVSTNEANQQPACEYKAIWDTGATNCTITKKIASQLDLKPVSMGKVAGVHGEKLVNIYFVSVFLPNKVCIPIVQAFECDELIGGAEMLVGMDIIALGDFSITHVDNKTTMTFRIPSIKRIDYVEEAKRLANQIGAMHSKKTKKEIKAKRKQERKNKKQAHKK